MKYLILFIILGFVSCKDITQKVTERPVLEFEINDSTRLSIAYELDGEQLILRNAEETIVLIPFDNKGDSIVRKFPVFNSYLVMHSLENLSGYYIDSSRQNPYPIPFKSSSVLLSDTPFNRKHHLEMTFGKETESPFKGKGLFETNGSEIKGTIRTETGDYRYLTGTINDGKYTFGAMDGSHVFVFSGLLENQKIQGTFYSGSHWNISFEGKENSHFELANADSLTAWNAAEVFDFQALDENGDTVSFRQDFIGQPTIIQILGSWCPNCMDETRYFVSLQKQYPDVQIIGVAFERSTDFDKIQRDLSFMKSDLGVTYPVLVGGKASKSDASQVFPMLSEIISFPTSIFVDKKGTIRKVHTGFNGPSTGEVYEEYKKETAALVERLIEE